VPILAPALTASIIGAGPGLVGPTWFKVASAVGTGVATWIKLGPAATVTQGVTTGAAGAGQVTGKAFVSPVVPIFVAAFAGVGMVGPTSGRIASAIGIGLALNVVSTGLYRGASVGVGAGVDTSKVVFVNAATLAPILAASFSSRGLVGPSAARMVIAITNGVAGTLYTGFGTGVVTGGAGPAPAAGTSVGWIT
jgi:hypothetical protein